MKLENSYVIAPWILLEDYTNIDLVKNFLENLNHPDVLNVITRDNALILKETTEIRKEEDELWSKIMNSRNKNNQE
jgi:hypothetical protein